MSIHVALPALNELGYIEKTLECLQKQSIRGFYVWVCVNQPESFHSDAQKQHICLNNAATLELLRKYPLDHLRIIDRTSPGKGWPEGKVGVGYARKTLMDAINLEAKEDDIIVSMDADTSFGEYYLESIEQVFKKNPTALALANPYYHPLKGDEVLDRAMLRYEIYMRYYAMNMRLTGTPYCYSPLGSAMAITIKGYRKINGMTPKKSGEDFYFLQKAVKAGRLLMHNHEVVYPGNRLSDRVFFGTGPAMIKGISGQWASYPLFHPALFQQVKETIALFPRLHKTSISTPMDEFLRNHFKEEDVFQPLRRNHKEPAGFIKACHEKIDGLRILQFLKIFNTSYTSTDEDNLQSFIDTHFPSGEMDKELKNLDFSATDVESINKIRNFLFQTERHLQKADNF
jgi:hypothetical protein